MKEITIFTRVVIILSVAFNTIYADSFLHQFFNKQTCDQVLRNDGYFTTCYSYKNKGAKYVAYTLEGSKVSALNIKKRPRFYSDLNIPKRYRSTYSDYTRNLYQMDRGHLAPDAAFDYSHRSLEATYVLSNIVPQYKTINRSKKMWAGVERYARYVARKLGKVKVLNGVEYGVNPRRIGRDQIAIPSAFWKMIYNKSKNFKRCFYFTNVKQKATSIRDFIVDCSKLIRR